MSGNRLVRRRQPRPDVRNAGQVGAKSLGGYVPQAGGGAIEFVLLQNGDCIANNYKPLWDQLGQALGPYPTGPTAETLAPR